MKQTLKIQLQRYSLLLFLLSGIYYGTAQNINLEQPISGKPFKLSGTVAANTVYYNSNQQGGRLPFTYFVQGALNVGVYQFSMPISYSYSNQGDNFNYQIPFKFNRLSLHPKYKWIQAHIGDASMTFSPYTLSAHQFTGGGLELTPKGKFKISAMAGRLLKATEDNDDPRTIPAFKRMGYGSKLAYTAKKFSVGLIGFYAKDDINSISVVPEEKNVTPKENVVVSVEGTYKITKSLELKAEYASSAVTEDLRAPDSNNKGYGLASNFLQNKTATSFYNAIKAAVDYKIKKSSVGLAYERIDPGYNTLGAYYFNSDFENITINAATSLFKDKLNLSFNIGYQRDDLDQQKESTSSRNVGAINATFSASERLNITGSFSNFTTFTNLKPDQFEIINDDNLLDNERDALDYKQLSKNANLNVNYIISKKENLQQNININYALADVSNEQGGVVRLGDASTFHNFNTSYNLSFPNKNLSIIPAINATYNTIGREDALTWGPTLAINKKFFEKTLNTTFASSYNSSTNKVSKTSVLNFRANAGYTYKKKHNFNLTAIQLFKNGGQRNTQSLTITFGYNYAFDINKIKINLPTRDKKPKQPKDKKEKKLKDKKKKKVKVKKNKKAKKSKTKKVKKVKKVKKGKKPRPKKVKKPKVKKAKVFGFKYREHTFKGIPKDITPKVTSIKTGDKFKSILKINRIKEKLAALEEEVINNEDNNKRYKKAALTYLGYLYSQKDVKDKYNMLVFKSLKKLYSESSRLSYIIEKSYIEIQGKVNSQAEKDPIDLENLKKKEAQLKAHTYMLDKLEKIILKDVVEDKGLLKKFKKTYLNKVFEMLQDGTKEIEIRDYLELHLIDMYHKDALNKTK